jgi:hypothetical protein
MRAQVRAELQVTLEAPFDPGVSAAFFGRSTPVVDNVSVSACIEKTLQPSGAGAYRRCSGFFLQPCILFEWWRCKGSQSVVYA